MADDQITIFNFEDALGEILAVVNGIASNYVTSDRFNQVLASVDQQNVALSGISNKQDAILLAIKNLTTLWQALLAQLSGVATTTLQNQEIALLQEIIGFTATKRPVKVGIDLSSVVTTSQAVPAVPGP